jgi:hypothetical protein
MEVGEREREREREISPWLRVVVRGCTNLQLLGVFLVGERDGFLLQGVDFCFSVELGLQLARLRIQRIGEGEKGLPRGALMLYGGGGASYLVDCRVAIVAQVGSGARSC